MKEGRLPAVLSLSLMAIGMALMAMMVVKEGELGALPLALVAIGATGFAVTRLRAKRRS